MLKIKKFVFNPFEESTYLVINPADHTTAIVDPGMFSPGEQAILDKFIADNNLKVTQLINTHLHVDHCIGNNYVKTRYGVKAMGHKDDAFLGERVAEQTRTFGIVKEDGEPSAVTIDVELKEGDRVELGDDHLEVLHVPGHSPGSIALYSPSGNFVITGDALFASSIGRTDLPGGDMSQLIASIRSRLYTLPDSTVVLPGHGPATTIGAEKRSNPFTR